MIMLSILKLLLKGMTYNPHSIILHTADNEKILLGNAQHIGSRSCQEDSCGFSSISPEAVKKNGILAVVADGMGGLSNGKSVSSDIVYEYLDRFNSPASNYESGSDLKKAAEEINESICRKYCADGSISAGSTLVGVLIKNHRMHWISVGDSRIYLKRKNRLIQVNEEHNFFLQLLEKVIDEEITLSQAASDKRKNALYSCFGMKQFAALENSKNGFELVNGDKIILCSDGVYNSLEKDEFNRLLTHSPQHAANSIISHIADKAIPAQDNMTILIIAYYKR